MTHEPGKREDADQEGSQRPVKDPRVEQPQPSERFDPFRNEGDMFKIVLGLGAAALAIVVVIVVVRAIS